MSIKRYIFIIVFSLIFFNITESRAAFMDPGFGARPMSMGGAFTAVSDDANAPAWNPAGMVSVEDITMNFMHSRLFTGLNGVDIHLNFASAVIPPLQISPLKDMGSFGVAWKSLVSKSLYREDTLILAYADRINKYFDAGLGLKYLGRGYTLDRYALADPVFSDGSSSHSLTADLGLILRPAGNLKEGLRLGISAQNLIPADTGIQKREIVPAVIRMGAAYQMRSMKMLGRVSVNRAVVAFDLSYRDQRWGEDFGHKINLHMGAEGWFLQESLALRCGINNYELALGAGYITFLDDIKTGFNYAFALPFKIQSSYGTHRISIDTRF